MRRLLLVVFFSGLTSLAAAQADLRTAHEAAVNSTVRLRSPSQNWGSGWVAQVGNKKVIITNHDVATEGGKFPWNLATKREYTVQYYRSKVVQKARPVVHSEDIDFVVMDVVSGDIPAPGLQASGDNLIRGQRLVFVGHVRELTGANQQEERAFTDRLLGPRLGTGTARFLSFVSAEGIVAGAVSSRKGRCGDRRSCVLVGAYPEPGTSGAVLVSEDGNAVGMVYGLWPGTRLTVGLDSQTLKAALDEAKAWAERKTK